MKMEQKIIIRREQDGELHGFLESPGSLGSLQRHLDEGWLLKFSYPRDFCTVFLLERTTKESSRDIPLVNWEP